MVCTVRSMQLWEKGLCEAIKRVVGTSCGAGPPMHACHACIQVAKKHADRMPVAPSLRSVKAASKLSLSALHAELAALRASLQALAAMLAALPDAPGDAFKQARALRRPDPHCLS